jgi:hypothetical protein
VQHPIGDEDSSAAQPRMQSSVPAGESSRPSRRCRSRGNPETQIRQTGVRDSGQPEDPSPARSRDRGFGATRRFTLGDAGRCRSRGNPELVSPGRRRVRDAGKPVDPPDGAAEGAKSRGNPGIHRRNSRRMRGRGNPETHREALQEERGTGATWGFTEGSADRVRDSRQLEDPSPASGQMQDAGRPVESSGC